MRDFDYDGLDRQYDAEVDDRLHELCVENDRSATMTNHKQGQSPVWTRERIEKAMKEYARSDDEFGMGSLEVEVTVSVEVALEIVDAWQADHDQLVTANEQMAGQISALAAERDGLVAKLDAANARIAELRDELDWYNATRATCSAAWCEIDNEVERLQESEADNEG